MTFTLIVPPTVNPIPFSIIGLTHYISQDTSPSLPFEYRKVDVKVEFDQNAQNICLKESSTEIKDVNEILSALGRAAGVSGQSEEKGLVENYQTEGAQIPSQAFPQLTSTLDKLDDALYLHSFLVGYAPTTADFAIWGGIKTSSPAQGILKKGQHLNVSRFINFFDALSTPITQAFLAAKSKKASSKTTASSFNLGLKNAKEGQVVTRFPPEPSGYLHIGHIKAAMLNDYFAKMYKGTLRIRLDDTNPVKEDVEYQDVILEDLKMLNIESSQISYTSDYFQMLYDKAIELIKLGKAFVDDTPAEELKQLRLQRQPSKYRDMPVDEVLKVFGEMAKGTEEGSKWVLRAKINYADTNGTLRDPNIYRVVPNANHHRTGTHWKVYPLYDFCMPIVDSIEGVTHALRSNEYHERNPLYNWIVDTLGMRRAEIWDFGRMNFAYTLLSKRKLSKLVEAGSVKGWNDPRFATVRGILRRGMTVEALREFILLQGPSQQVVNLSWDQIWALNKQRIDPIIPRFTAVEKPNVVKVLVNGAPQQPESKELQRHQKNPDVGKKTVYYYKEVLIDQEDAKSFDVGEEITLMAWGNAIVNSKEVDGQGTVTSLCLDLHLEGDFKKTKKKVTWISQLPDQKLVNIRLLDYDYLINKPKLEESDNLEEFLTPVTEFITEGLADVNVKSMKKGDRFQFERKGYYIVDAISEDGVMDMIKIPDGKATSVISKGDEKAQASKAPKKDKREKKSQQPSSSSSAPSLTDRAPAEAKSFIQLSDRTEGFEIPYKSKMYASPRVYGDGAVDTPVKTQMFKVDPIHKSN